MRYCFDIDNTICFTIGNDYASSFPNKKIVSDINKLYDKGNYIILFTARGASSGIDWFDFTKDQLDCWGLKYHELICNKKPNADLFIDDKAVNIKDWNININLKGIVFGAFDLLHPGYIKFLSFCRENCGYLTVALQDDPSEFRSNKNKPIFSLFERKEILLSLRSVDDVIFYSNENDLVSLLESGNYDVRFLGSDYVDKIDSITGHNILPIVFHNRDHDWSYSRVCKMVYENYKLKKEKRGV